MESILVSASLAKEIVENLTLEKEEEDLYNLSAKKDYETMKNEEASSNSNTPNTGSNISNNSGSNKGIGSLRSKLNTSSRAYDARIGRHSPDFAIFKEEGDNLGISQNNEEDEYEHHSDMEHFVSHVVRDTDSPVHKNFKPNQAFKSHNKEDTHSVSSNSAKDEEQESDPNIFIHEENKVKMSGKFIGHSKGFPTHHYDVKSSKSVPYQRLDPVQPNRNHKSTPQKASGNSYSQTIQHVHTHGHYIQSAYPQKAHSFQQPPVYPQYQQQMVVQGHPGGYYPPVQSQMAPGYGHYPAHGAFQHNYAPGFGPAQMSQPSEARSLNHFPKQGSFSAKTVAYHPPKHGHPAHVSYGQSLSQGAPGLLKVPASKGHASGLKQKNISSPMLHNSSLGFAGIEQQ